MSLRLFAAGPPRELLLHISHTISAQCACKTVNQHTCHHVFWHGNSLVCQAKISPEILLIYKAHTVHKFELSTDGAKFPRVGMYSSNSRHCAHAWQQHTSEWHCIPWRMCSMWTRCSSGCERHDTCCTNVHVHARMHSHTHTMNKNHTFCIKNQAEVTKCVLLLLLHWSAT